jgi:DNA-binding transcriptional ArsR family regulator
MDSAGGAADKGRAALTGLDNGCTPVHNQIVLKLTGYEMPPSDRLDATFMALADPTRRAILARLAQGEVSVTELAKPFDMSQPAISKHLKVLERAGLVTRSKEATRRPVKIEAMPLAEASEFLEKYRQFWENRYQRLDALLGELQPEKGPNFKPNKQ